MKEKKRIKTKNALKTFSANRWNVCLRVERSQERVKWKNVDDDDEIDWKGKTDKICWWNKKNWLNQTNKTSKEEQKKATGN